MDIGDIVRYIGPRSKGDTSPDVGKITNISFDDTVPLYRVACQGDQVWWADESDLTKVKGDELTLWNLVLGSDEI